MTDEHDSAENSAARMVLEPKTVHEGGDAGPSIDCPQCGATVSLTRIIEEGRCTGVLDAGTAEVESEDEPVGDGCSAELGLELVWKA